MLSKQTILFHLVFAFSMMLSAFDSYGQQLKLGNNPTSIEKSAVLQLDSKNQGLLLTRLSDTTAINNLNPPDGMLIYLTEEPNTGVYVHKNGGWRKSDQIFETIHPTGAIKFATSYDTVTLNIPNASTDRGVVSTTPSGQTFHADKTFQDSLVSLSVFRSNSEAKIGNKLILKKSPVTIPGYLLSTDATGKVLLQTHPNTWIVGGNTIASGMANSVGTISNTGLPVVTNSQERMRITPDGKTGIDTPSPNDTLDVNGSFKLGKEGSSFERMGEGEINITNYLSQINILSILILPLPDRVGPFVFIGDLPGIKKNALTILNPQNDINILNMSIKLLGILTLPLGNTKVRIAWARAPQDGKIEIGLLFDFNGVSISSLQLFLINSNLTAIVSATTDPINLNVLYCNPN